MKNPRLFRSFTLVEFILVLSLIVILIILFIFFLKPTEVLKRGKDNKRILDINNFNKLVKIMFITMPDFSLYNYVTPKTVYLSLPDNSTSCASYQNQLPPLPSGWSYRCSPNPQNIDGTGWIPIPFNTNPSVKISKLPLDPINKPPYYYSFIVDDGYKFASNLESTSYKGPEKLSSKDGGIRDDIYEVGSQLTLLVPYSRQQETFISFVKAIGGVNEEYTASFIQQTSDGGYILGGYTNSFGAGSDDDLIIKLDSLGNIEWAKTIGGSGADHAYFIRQTSDGGYIITGRTNSAGAGSHDYFVVKLNSSGEAVWMRTIGGGGAEYSDSICQTSDGGYIVVGRTTSFGAGSSDVLVVKLNPAGEIEWARTIGGSGAEYAYSVQQTSDGGYIVGGHTTSFGAGDYNVLIIKLTNSGNVEWAKIIGGSGTEYFNYIQQTLDGGYIMSGKTSSFGAGNDDYFIVKLNSLGEVIWAEAIGGSNAEQARAIRQTSEGGYIVGGYTSSFGAGNRDALIVKLDSLGNIEWAKTIGGLYDETSSFIQQTLDGGYISTGRTTSFGAGGGDLFIVKLDSSGNCSNCSLIQSVSPTFTPISINSIIVYPATTSPSVTSSQPSLSLQDITSQINVNTICNCSSGSMINFKPLAMSLPSLTEIIKIIEEKIERIIRK